MIRGINSPNVSFLYCTPHVNPPGSTPRIHQHLDIDQGQVNWDEFFATRAHISFDGIATVCVFAQEDRARESLIYNRQTAEPYINKYLAQNGAGRSATES